MHPKWKYPEGHYEVTYDPPLTLQVCGQRLNDEGFHYRHPICTLGSGLGHPRVKAGIKLTLKTSNQKGAQ